MASKGRPKKSTEKHKLDGTYQECRHGNNADVVIADILTVPEKIEVPDAIKKLNNKSIESAFKNHAEMLIKLKSIYEVDISELIHLYLILNDIYELRNAMTDIDIKKDFFIYERMQSLFLNQVKTFNALGSKFFLTPQARMQMTIGNLQALNENLRLQEKIKEAETNPVQRLINKKRS